MTLIATAQFLDNKDYTGLPVTVRQLTLDGNKAHNKEAKTDGLVLRSWLSVVEDVHMTDMNGNGLRVTNRSVNGTKLKTTQVNGRISATSSRTLAGTVFSSRIHKTLLPTGSLPTTGSRQLRHRRHPHGQCGGMVRRAEPHLRGAATRHLCGQRSFATSICDNYIEEFGADEASRDLVRHPRHRERRRRVDDREQPHLQLLQEVQSPGRTTSAIFRSQSTTARGCP